MPKAFLSHNMQPAFDLPLSFRLVSNIEADVDYIVIESGSEWSAIFVFAVPIDEN
jgi:hypothetical protein